MSEAAFADILNAQLPGAKILQEVYYKDPASKKWSENDTLILIEDVLFLVEAKAGAAATITFPALDFGRHAQSVQDLVIKAYKQCERFFNYLNSADEVPLYHLVDGRYVECARVRHADYRVMVPIGLTVESFSPFSAFCKELPQVEPLLGKNAFVSLSIDDLFVLRRLLATPGEFAHYMEVRQAFCGGHARRPSVRRSRPSWRLSEEEPLRPGPCRPTEGRQGEHGRLGWHEPRRRPEFRGRRLGKRPASYTEVPAGGIRNFSGRSMPAVRRDGFQLRVTSGILLGGAERPCKHACRASQLLHQHPARYFLYGSGTPFFIWLQRSGDKIDWRNVHDKASAAALLTPTATLPGS